MHMMAVRGVWATNLAAFLLGGGMYACFLLLPQFAQLPASTGFGYGASVVVAGLYLLPCALGMGLLGSVAGRIERRFSSRFALITGTAVGAVACGWLAIVTRPVRPADQLDPARRRHRARVRSARQPDRAGGPAEPDRRRQRDEHRGAHAWRRGRRPDGRHLRGRQYAARVARAARFTETFAMAAVFLAAWPPCAVLIPLPRPGRELWRDPPQVIVVQVALTTKNVSQEFRR